MMGAVKGIARAAATGVAWAIAWAPIAVLLGVLIIDPDNSMDEMWLVIGAYPGFLSGAIFSALVAVAERRRAPGERSPVRGGALGAVAGLLVGALPAAIAEPSTGAVGLAILGSITGMAAISGALSVLVFRTLRRRRELGRA